MATTIKTTFQLHRGNAEVWAKNNPVLAAGEPGFELDTGKLKIGNGNDTYNNLPYLSADDILFTFTITPTNGPGSQMLSVTRAEMLAALDAGKTLLGYWTETRTILETTDTIKHEFRLESVSGTGADRGLAFVNYEQFYKSTLYVNGNDTVSFVDKEVLPNPTTKTEAMTQSVGMDNDGRLWTEPGADGKTPHIGDNGNWYLGDTDTGNPSRGEMGPQGPAGPAGAGMDITGATVGQIAKITAVDDSGKPTAWEAVDDRLPNPSPSDNGKALAVEQTGEFEYGYGFADIPNILDFIDLGITNASPGQLAKVKFVDDFGKPLAWEAVDMPDKLPNPNALTFTGAVNGTYDVSNPVSIEIPSAVTDDHINSLIDTKLGVIENGSY